MPPIAPGSPYTPGHERLVVSPECARKLLTAFISRAKKQLLIYNIKVSDRMLLRTLEERQNAGVEIRVIGKVDKGLSAAQTRKLAGLRLHVRAIVRDGSAIFVGSQSLRKLELDGRREVGIIVTDARAAKKIQSVFESDWASSGPAPHAEKDNEKDKDADAPPIPVSAAR